MSDADHAFWTVFVFCSSANDDPGGEGLPDRQRAAAVGDDCAAFALHDLARQPVMEAGAFLAIALGIGSLTKPMILLTVGGTALILAIFSPWVGAGKVTNNPRDQSPCRSRQIFVGLLLIAIIVFALALSGAPSRPGVSRQSHGRSKSASGNRQGRAQFSAGLSPGIDLGDVFPVVACCCRWRSAWAFAIARIRPCDLPSAAVIGPWLVLEFFGTKLPHYILAAFPALAFLTANAIIHSLRGDDRDWQSRSFLVGADSGPSRRHVWD